VKLGVRLPNGGPIATHDNLRKVVAWADDLGFDGVWIGDHVILPERSDSIYPYGGGGWSRPPDTPVLDPVVALSLAAAWSSRLTVGTSVLILPLRNPVLIAKQIATLDALSGGRVRLGLGVGWLREEFELVGAPFDDRGRRSDEMTHLMRALWSGEVVRYDGAFWSVRGGAIAPSPTRRAVAILWGGHSDAALRRIARLGDGWMPIGLDAAALAERAEVLRRLVRRAGRDPEGLEIVARPDQPLSRALVAAHRAVGVREIITDPPMRLESLADCRAEMERTAEVVRAS
jgi:probable F420-dependent oxidoreductase